MGLFEHRLVTAPPRQRIASAAAPKRPAAATRAASAPILVKRANPAASPPKSRPASVHAANAPVHTTLPTQLRQPVRAPAGPRGWTVAAAAVQVTTPAFAVAAHTAVDAAVLQRTRLQRAHLDDLLDRNAHTAEPKVVLAQYLRSRCALAAASAAYASAEKPRNLALENWGRSAINGVARVLGQGVAGALALPAELAGAERGRKAAAAAGNAVARGFAWPLHVVVEAASLSLTAVAVLLAAAATVAGFVAGWAAAAVVLAITPSFACGAWLRGRALERSAKRHAEDATSWLQHTFGTAPSQAPSAPSLLSFVAPRAAAPAPFARVAIDPLAFAPLSLLEWRYDRQLQALTDVPMDRPLPQEQLVGLLQQDARDGAAQMPWLSRQLLGTGSPQAASEALAQAHGEVASLLAYAHRARRINVLLLQRAGKAVDSETGAR